MINDILSFIRDGVTYIKDHPQFLLTLLLIIVIPIAFLFSGQQFLKASRDNQDRLEIDRIGLLHDSFRTIISVSDVDPELITEQITDFAELNPDIVVFRVSNRTSEGYIPLAALDEDDVPY